MRSLNLLILMLISFIRMSCSTQDFHEYNWKEIKAFKFYGQNNPLVQKDSKYILADVEVVSELLNNSRKSEGYLPKGGQNYATLIFNSLSEITIQILPGLPAPIRVVRGKLFDDEWFDFDEETGMKWIKYMHELKLKLAE